MSDLDQNLLSSLVRNHRAGFIWSKLGALKQSKAAYPYVEFEGRDQEEAISHPELSRVVELHLTHGDADRVRAQKATRTADLLLLEASQRLDDLVSQKLQSGGHKSGVVSVAFQSFGRTSTQLSAPESTAVIGYLISVHISSVATTVRL